MKMIFCSREAFERYKAIVIGLVFALFAVTMCCSLTSCHTIKTIEVEKDSTYVKNYQTKIDSLTKVISRSESKAEYQHKLDSLISLRVKSEITAEKEGTIINYNNDGSIVSREEYHINLNEKKDTDKDVKVNSDTSYKQEIQTLMDRINTLYKTINQKDSTIYRLSEKTRSECNIAHFEGVLVYTYLIFFGWFVFSIPIGVRYVWKKFKTKEKK